jgi:hypothetical protein
MYPLEDDMSAAEFFESGGTSVKAIRRRMRPDQRRKAAARLKANIQGQQE